MPNFTQQYPTRGDLAREQLRRRGLPFFLDVQAEVKARLAKLSAPAWKAFALSSAERVMQGHERLPAAERSSTLAVWRLLLDAMWAGLREPTLKGDLPRRLRRAVAQLVADEDLDDEDPAVAALYAAECYVKDELDAALHAGSVVVNAAFAVARAELRLDSNEFVWDPSAEPMPLAQEAMHPAVQGELSRQREIVALLESFGVTPAVLDSLTR